MHSTTPSWVVCFLVLLAPIATGAEYHVAPHGSDANRGTEAQPFATLQRAVEQLKAGDTLLIHGGVYRETVRIPRSGHPGAPITLRPYRGQTVIISGCDPITGWTRNGDGTWDAPMPWTLGTGRNQVFADEQVLIEARHPNTATPGLEMYVDGLSPLWPTFAKFSIPQETRVDQPGRIVSDLLAGQPDDYWKGALYYGIHYEGWAAQTGVIESSRDGEIMVGDRTRGWWFGSAYGGGYPAAHEEGRGMIVGHRHALDQPGEWHWQNDRLLLIPVAGQEPRERERAPIDSEWYVYPPGIGNWAERYAHRDLTLDFVSWVEGARKTIVSSKLDVEVYDLVADPLEEHPLELDDEARDAARRRALDWWEAHPVELPDAVERVDDGTLERMRALGYIGDDESS